MTAWKTLSGLGVVVSGGEGRDGIERGAGALVLGKTLRILHAAWARLGCNTAEMSHETDAVTVLCRPPPPSKKVKCAILLLEFRRGAHLPS